MKFKGYCKKCGIIVKAKGIHKTCPSCGDFFQDVRIKGGRGVSGIRVYGNLSINNSNGKQTIKGGGYAYSGSGDITIGSCDIKPPKLPEIPPIEDELGWPLPPRRPSPPIKAPLPPWAETCEECGTKKHVKQRGNGWIYTLCWFCYNKYMLKLRFKNLKFTLWWRYKKLIAKIKKLGKRK